MKTTSEQKSAEKVVIKNILQGKIKHHNDNKNDLKHLCVIFKFENNNELYYSSDVMGLCSTIT